MWEYAEISGIHWRGWLYALPALSLMPAVVTSGWAQKMPWACLEPIDVVVVAGRVVRGSGDGGM